MIITVQNFHDLYLKPFPEGTGAKASAALFAALKPGGTLVVVDHSAADGSGTTLSDSLHRIDKAAVVDALTKARSEEHTSELQSLMRISYAVFCLKKKKPTLRHDKTHIHTTH